MKRFFKETGAVGVSNNDAEEKEKESVQKELKGMKAQMKKDAKLMNEAEGKDLSSDVKVVGLTSALDTLEGLVSQKQVTDPEKWKFPYTPFEQFKKTPRDLFVSYLRWSVKDPEPDPNKKEQQKKDKKDRQDQKDEQDDKEPKLAPIDETKQEYNVDKAFRRLSNYASWMFEEKELFREPLTRESVRETATLGSFIGQKTDKLGRVAWYLDLSRADLSKPVDWDQILRWMVWLLHEMAFDEAVQKNGIVFVEDLAHIGFWNMKKLMNPELQNRSNGIFQGASAVKIKKMLIFRAPWYITALMAFMKIFLSKKLV